MQGIGRSLRTLWTIFKHEFNMYFGSPLVYFIGAVWLFLAGGFFSLSLVAFHQSSVEPSMSDVLWNIAFLMIFFAPALTMRLVSEELRNGTHELLFTAPVRDWEIIVAKWLAVWAVFTLYMLVTVIFPLILIWRGNPDTGVILTGYLGLWLLSGATLAVGVFASALTQYQLVAYLVTAGALVLMWVMQGITQSFNSTGVRTVLQELSLPLHYQNLAARAVIDPLDIAYYVGLMAIFLFLASQVLSTRRWSA
jgi:ABC-2 type transport system permease protein